MTRRSGADTPVRSAAVASSDVKSDLQAFQRQLGDLVYAAIVERAYNKINAVLQGVGSALAEPSDMDAMLKETISHILEGLEASVAAAGDDISAAALHAVESAVSRGREAYAGLVDRVKIQIDAVIRESTAVADQVDEDIVDILAEGRDRKNKDTEADPTTRAVAHAAYLKAADFDATPEAEARAVAQAVLAAANAVVADATAKASVAGGGADAKTALIAATVAAARAAAAVPMEGVSSPSPRSPGDALDQQAIKGALSSGRASTEDQTRETPTPGSSARRSF